MTESKLMLIYGQERYLIDKEIERVRAGLGRNCGAEPEVVFIDADELTPEQLLEQLDFSPLFALERVIEGQNPPQGSQSGTTGRWSGSFPQ